MALEKSCPVFLKEKEIRKIMCENNITYRKALSKYLDEKKTPMAHQIEKEIIHNESNYISNEKMSYRDALATKTRSEKQIQVRSEQNTYCEENEEQSMEESENSLILGKSVRKPNKRKKKSGPSHNRTLSNEEEPSISREKIENTEEPTKRVIDFKRLFNKLKQVCLSECSFDVKVKLLCNLIFEQCFQLVWRLLKEGDVYNKIISMFKDGLFT